jgi:hypothetical protein
VESSEPTFVFACWVPKTPPYKKIPFNERAMLIEKEFLDRDVWDGLSRDEAERIGRSLADCLPDGWKLHTIEKFSQEDQDRFILTFQAPGLKDRWFNFVPGGEVQLGIGEEVLNSIPEAWLDAWQFTETEFGFPPLKQYLAERFTPQRRVYVEPMLMEQSTWGWRVGTNQMDTELDLFAEHLEKAGFRLPTADEWEWACSGGTSCLWRWGNDIPRKHLAFDYSRGEPGTGRNAFGLMIGGRASNTEWVSLHKEMTSRERGGKGTWELRGGDGGEAETGAYGDLCIWLTRSIRYRPLTFEQMGLPDTTARDDLGDARRVLSLSDYVG